MIDSCIFAEINLGGCFLAEIIPIEPAIGNSWKGTN